MGNTGPRGVQGAKGLRGVADIQSPPVIMVNEVNVAGNGDMGIRMFWIYRFNWRLDMVRKYVLSSIVYQRIGRVS